MKKYCEKHDSYFESKTGKWLEGKCPHKNCEFCKNKPEIHEPHAWEFVVGMEGLCK